MAPRKPSVTKAHKPEPAPLLAEVGSTGLAHNSGRLAEEFLHDLRGPAAIKRYKRMSKNLPIIGALLYLVEMYIRAATWGVEAAAVDENGPLAAEAKRAAELHETAMHDMEISWQEFVSDAILTAIVYGFFPAEIVWKIRGGEQPGLKHLNSKHADGAWGIRRLGPRHPDTLDRWDIDRDGTVTAMFQRPPPDYRERRIPMDRLFLFRIRAPKDSPEGESMLRTSHRPAYFLENLEDLEAIGYERDLAGLFVYEVPPEIMHPNADSAKASIRTQAEETARRVRRNEMEGLVIPAEEDRQGKTGFRARLMTSGGARQVNADVTIRRHEARVLMTFAAEFLLLGQEPNGSRALGESKVSTFALALQAIATTFAQQFDDQVLSDLMRMNGVPRAAWSKTTVSPIDAPDLAAIATYVQTGIASGVLTPGDDLERWYRERGSLPELAEGPGAIVVPEAEPAPSPAPAPTNGASGVSTPVPIPGSTVVV